MKRYSFEQINSVAGKYIIAAEDDEDAKKKRDAKLLSSYSEPKYVSEIE